jgi:hypothetical protein
MDDPRRETLKESLRSRLEQTIDERVDRFLAVHHQQIAADHHFSLASSECIALYRDGYFLSCVLATQAVNEAIVEFIAERNAVTRVEGEQNPNSCCASMRKASSPGMWPTQPVGSIAVSEMTSTILIPRLAE